MKKQQIFLTFTFILLLQTMVFAQQENVTNPKHTGEVTIIAPYQPSIQDARKINISPNIEVYVPEKKKLSYQIEPQKITTNITLKPMKAVKVAKQKKLPLMTNFIKGGIGTYLTGYGELFSTSKPSDEYRLGIHLKHFSRSGKMDDVANPKNSYNHVKIFGEKYFDESSLYTSLFFNRNVFHYYGFNPESEEYTLPNDDFIRQRTMTYGGDIKLESIENDDFEYAVGVGYKGWQNLEKPMENTAHLNIFGKKYVDWFDFLTHQAIAGHLDYNFYNVSYSSTKTINTISARPFLDFKSGVYDIKLGVNVLSVNTIDSESFKSQLHLFPDIKAKINVVPNYFAFIGGISGYHKYMGYSALSDINPYINNNIEKDISIYKLDAYVGVSGNIMQYADYTLSLGYQDVENFPLFTTDFNVIHDNMFAVDYQNMGITRFHAGIGLNQWRNIAINTAFNYFAYKLKDVNITPWHLPDFTTEISAKYMLQDDYNIPLSITLKTALQSGRKAQNKDHEIVKLKNIVDLSLHAEYKYNEHLGAFLSLNNLLNQRYEQWYQYPSYRFNALIGASYAF